MWNLLRHYGIPKKIVRLIELLYEDFQCAVMHEGEISCWFKVKSGQKQGCLLSPLLFLIAINWLMREATKRNQTGIDWKGGTKLEDLDFADDLALISSNFEDLQAKTKETEEIRKKIGLKINTAKTKTLRNNLNDRRKVKVGESEIEEVSKFTYLGSVMDRYSGSDADLDARIVKSQTAFKNLSRIWSSKKIAIKT